MRPVGYYERGQILRDLGFKDYQEYLKSRLWKSIRAGVLGAHGGLCSVCPEDGPRKARQVHHREYTLENLNGSSMAGLYAICKICHSSVEVDKKKNGYMRKKSLTEAQSRFDSLISKKSIHRSVGPEVMNAWNDMQDRLSEEETHNKNTQRRKEYRMFDKRRCIT